jgi:hypothetical protein
MKISAASIASLILSMTVLAPQMLAAEDIQPPAVVGETLALSPFDPTLEWAPCNEDAPKGCEIIMFADKGEGPRGGFVRTAPGHMFPPHWTSTDSVWVDLKSRFTRYIDGKPFDTIPPQTFVHVPAGEIRSGRCEDGCLMYFKTDGPFDFHLAE